MLVICLGLCSWFGSDVHQGIGERSTSGVPRAHSSCQSCNRVKDDEAHVPLDDTRLERLQAFQQGRGCVDGVNGHLKGGKG